MTVWDYSNHIEEKVATLDSEAKSVRCAENKAEEKAKAIEENVKDAKRRTSQAESARKKVEDDLVVALSEHSRYLQADLPATLD